MLTVSIFFFKLYKMLLPLYCLILTFKTFPPLLVCLLVCFTCLLACLLYLFACLLVLLVCLLACLFYLFACLLVLLVCLFYLFACLLVCVRIVRKCRRSKQGKVRLYAITLYFYLVIYWSWFYLHFSMIS